VNINQQQRTLSRGWILHDQHINLFRGRTRTTSVTENSHLQFGVKRCGRSVYSSANSQPARPRACHSYPRGQRPFTALRLAAKRWGPSMTGTRRVRGPSPLDRPGLSREPRGAQRGDQPGINTVINGGYEHHRADSTTVTWISTTRRECIYERRLNIGAVNETYIPPPRPRWRAACATPAGEGKANTAAMPHRTLADAQNELTLSRTASKVQIQAPPVAV